MGSCLLSCISILRVMRLRFICLRQTVSKIKTAITVNPAGTRGKRARLNAKGTVNIPKTETRETANRSSPKAEFSGLSFWIIPSMELSGDTSRQAVFPQRGWTGCTCSAALLLRLS